MEEPNKEQPSSLDEGAQDELKQNDFWDELLNAFDSLSAAPPDDTVEGSGKSGSGSIFNANAHLRPGDIAAQDSGFDRSPGPTATTTTTTTTTSSSSGGQVPWNLATPTSASLTGAKAAQPGTPQSGVGGSAKSTPWLVARTPRISAQDGPQGSPFKARDPVPLQQPEPAPQTSQEPLPESLALPEESKSSSFKDKASRTISALRNSMGKTNFVPSPLKKKHKDHDKEKEKDKDRKDPALEKTVASLAPEIDAQARARAASLRPSTAKQASFNHLMQVAARYKRVIGKLFSDRQVQTLERRVNDLKAAMSEHLIKQETEIAPAYFESRFEDAVMDLFISGYNVVYVTTQLPELAERFRPIVCEGIRQIEQALSNAGTGPTTGAFDMVRRNVLFDVVGGMQWAFLDLYPTLMFKRVKQLVEQELKSQIKLVPGDLADMFRSNDKKGFAYLAMGICYPQTVKLLKIVDDTLFSDTGSKWLQASDTARAEIENCLYQLLDAFEPPPLLAECVRITGELADARCDSLGASASEKQLRQRQAKTRIISAVMLKGLTPRFVTGLEAHTILSTLLTKAINNACISLLGETSNKGLVLQDPALTERLQTTYVPMLTRKLASLITA